MEKNNNTNFAVIAIVAIVAIVGMIGLIKANDTNDATTMILPAQMDSGLNSVDGNLAGDASQPGLGGTYSQCLDLCEAIGQKYTWWERGGRMIVDYPKFYNCVNWCTRDFYLDDSGSDDRYAGEGASTEYKTGGSTIYDPATVGDTGIIAAYNRVAEAHTTYQS